MPSVKILEEINNLDIYLPFINASVNINGLMILCQLFRISRNYQSNINQTSFFDED
jgi:hypothetical protein